MNRFAAWWILLINLCAWLPAGIADDIFYDENWAGRVRRAVADNTSASINASSLKSTTCMGFNTVQATLVMPRLALPRHPSRRIYRYTAATWIGLDGSVMSDDEDLGTQTSTVCGLWQARVFMSIRENVTAAYTEFYEW